MAKILFDFLSESFLFNDKHIIEKYSRISEKELEKELIKYREYSLSKANTLLNDIRSSDKYLSVTMQGFDSFLPTENLVKQCALYMDAVVVNDPLFRLTSPSSKVNSVMRQYEGLKAEDGINKEDLLEAIIYMKNLTPAVAADFASFFPMSFIHEPSEELPVYASENYFSDILPPELLKWFQKRAKVFSMKKEDDGWVVLDSLQVGRAIFIEFEGHNGRSSFYKLYESETLSSNEETRMATIRMSLPKEPPELDYFNAWVFQSTNRSARALYDEVMAEIYYSSVMGNSYFTRSPMVTELLDYQFGATKGVRETSSMLGLNLDLPSIKNVTLEKLMSVRTNDGEAFHNFRMALSKQLRELRSISDPELLENKLKNIAHEFEDVQINEIGKKIRQLKRSVLAESIVFIAALCASSYYGLSTLLPALGGIGWGGIRSSNDKWTAIKDNPAYFLWKVKK